MRFNAFDGHVSGYGKPSERESRLRPPSSASSDSGCQDSANEVTLVLSTPVGSRSARIAQGPRREPRAPRQGCRRMRRHLQFQRQQVKSRIRHFLRTDSPTATICPANIVVACTTLRRVQIARNEMSILIAYFCSHCLRSFSLCIFQSRSICRSFTANLVKNRLISRIKSRQHLAVMTRKFLDNIIVFKISHISIQETTIDTFLLLKMDKN